MLHLIPAFIIFSKSAKFVILLDIWAQTKTTSANLSLESRTNIFPNIANKEEASLLEPFGLRDWLAFAKRVCVFVGYYHVLTSLLFTFHLVIFRPLVFQRTFEYVGSKSWTQAFLLLVIDSFEDDDFVKKWDMIGCYKPTLVKVLIKLIGWLEIQLLMKKVQIRICS